MRYLSLIILLIVMPRLLFPGREVIITFSSTSNLQKINNEIKPAYQLGVDVTKAGFIAISIENLAGNKLFSTNLGIKEKGHHNLILPVLQNQYQGFYKLRVFSDGSEMSSKLIYLPGIEIPED